MEKEKRIKELDLIRAISAIFIMLYHYTTRYEMSIGHIKSNYFLDVKYGYMAVAVFFILSGFLVAFKINEEKSSFKFFIKKLIRIYPSYIIAMILTTIVIFIGGEPFADRLCSVKEFIANLFILTQYLGVKQVDGVYWTLTIEMTFYIIVAGVILLKKNKNIKLLSLLWIIICLILNIISLYFNPMIIKGLKILFISTYSQLFIIGIIMCLIYKEENSKINYFTLLLCIINQYFALGLEYTIFLIVFVVLLYLIIIKIIKLPKWLCENRIVHLMSSISYPFYLVHQFIGFVIIYYLEKNNFIGEYNIIIPFIIMVGVAYLIHRFIETPFIKMWNEKMKKRSVV